jgi:hypothetical protein|nr:MAG TPA: tail length tape measure protein [Caudoviricetes sp.]
MATEVNPIHYKDLVSPDNSITDLIKQLDELSDTYTNTLKNIKGEAIQLTASLKGVSGATEEGRQATRKASSDAEKLARAYRETAFAESETAKKIAELKQATREANELNKLNVKLAQSAEGSYNKLSAQYSINKIYLNGMTRAEREQTEEGRKLVKQTAEIYEEMKRLQEVTGKHQLNVGNYGDFGKQFESISGGVSGYQEKIKSALGLNNKFGESLIEVGKSGGGVKTALAAIGDGVKALGASLLTLMANPVFLGIAGIAAAGAAFKWWYDYNAGLVEATRLTKEFTGLSGKELISVRNEIQACADVMGHDYKETLSTVDALMSNFGINAKQALKVVEDGYASGADLSGDMLDKIQNYSATFHDAGISASQMVAILSQTRSGIFSDKGLDTITMASKKIREMSTATQDAMKGIGIDVNQVQKDLATGARNTFDVIQEVSTKMKNFGANSTQVGAILKNVFGKNGADAGIKLIEQLDTMTTSIDKAKEQTGEWGKAQEEQIKATSELNDAMSALFDVTDKGFEDAIDQIKLIATKWLTAVVKGCIDVVNWVINMYNKTLAVRLAVANVVAQFKILFEVGRLLNNLVIDMFKGFGRLLDAFVTSVQSAFKAVTGVLAGFGETMEGIVNFDFDKIKKGVDGIRNSITNGFKNSLLSFGKAVKQTSDEVNNDVISAGKNIGKAFIDGFNQATSGKKLDNIVLPQSTATNVEPEKTKTITDYTPTGSNKKKVDKAAEKAAAAAERAYQETLAAKRKAEDAELDLLEEGYDKQRKRTEYYYTRQVEDLQHSLTLLKSNEVQRRTDITNTIAALQEKQNQVLKDMEEQHETEMLKVQADAIKLRLDAVKKGSEQEQQLKLELIENERQQALKENAAKPTDQRQDTSDINAKFDAKRGGVADEYIKAQLAIFDQQQALADSEFELLKNSEERKTQYRLQAEKARLQKILELNKIAGTQLSDIEIATIQNTIEKINQEIGESKTKEQSGSIYGMLGLNLSDEQKEAIDTSLNYALDALNTWIAAEVAAADAEVKRADNRVANAQKVLDTEREARANGYASNVAYAQKELDLAKKNQEKALKEQQKAQREQAAIQALEQIGNMVTASTMIWKQLGFPWAIPALAVMWGSFAFAKIKAMQMTRSQSESYGEGTVELLEGGSHQSGNDVDLGTKKDGTKRRAEGGEFFAVINKRNSKRYRRVIPDVIKSLNNGTFEENFSNAFAGRGIELTMKQSEPNLSELSDNVRGIREQNERKVYNDADGSTIIQYKNLTRKIIRK